MLELLKVVVTPVAIERDADGKVVGEKTGEPTALYDVDQVVAYVESLQAEIAAANASLDGGSIIAP